VHKKFRVQHDKCDTAPQHNTLHTTHYTHHTTTQHNTLHIRHTTPHRTAPQHNTLHTHHTTPHHTKTHYTHHNTLHTTPHRTHHTRHATPHRTAPHTAAVVFQPVLYLTDRPSTPRKTTRSDSRAAPGAGHGSPRPARRVTPLQKCGGFDPD
jgi:hypothetical protein